MNLNSKVSHLFLSLPEISPQGGEEFFLAEKGIVGEKVYFLAKKLLYLQKKVNFFPCSKKVILGLQPGLFVPQFSGGKTFCHYAYFLGQSHFKLRSVTLENLILRCPSFLNAPYGYATRGRKGFFRPQTNIFAGGGKLVSLFLLHPG